MKNNNIYIYIYIYSYIYIYIYIYIHIHIYIYIYILATAPQPSAPADDRRRADPWCCRLDRDTPNLPTKISPAKIRRLKLSGKSPVDMRMKPLKLKIMFESNPLKSRILVRRSAVTRHVRVLFCVTRPAKAVPARVRVHTRCSCACAMQCTRCMPLSLSLSMYMYM